MTGQQIEMILFVVASLWEASVTRKFCPTFEQCGQKCFKLKRNLKVENFYIKPIWNLKTPTTNRVCKLLD
jgi:hypothetical protein